MNAEETFYAAVAAAVQQWRETNFPAMDVIYENGPVPDEPKISSPWVELEVQWYAAQSLAVGEGSTGRAHGAVSVKVYTREGTGTASCDAVLASLREVLKPGRLGGAVIKYPHRYSPHTAAGWYKVGLLAPFWLDG